MHSTTPPLPFVLAMLLASVACPGATFAASTSGPIAVLDFDLKGTPIQTLDDNDVEVKGTLRVFVNHTTPLLPYGSLNLAKIRAGTTPSYGGSVSIDLKRHGASSLSHPKKSYSLDFKNPMSFLGMPEEQEWILHSCWADKTCLRNVIGYWQAARLSPWAPRTEFAEVFINGEYHGLYVVVEKVKLGPSRVNLLPPIPNWWLDDSATGTYILKQDGRCDKQQDPQCDYDWRTSYSDEPWQFVSPKEKELTPAQQDYIKDHTDYIDAKFTRGAPAYEPEEYDEVMDEQSAVDFVILQEIAYNVDAYVKSLHVTKVRDIGRISLQELAQIGHGIVPNHVPLLLPQIGLVHMGPIWDLDLAFANFYDRGYSVCSTDRWRIDDHPDFVFRPLQAMWKLPKFRQAISNRWWALRSVATVSRTRIENQLDAFTARITQARARDNRKWDTLGKETKFVDGRTRSWECWNKATYQEEVAALKQWIRAHITWMDARLLEGSFLNP